MKGLTSKCLHCGSMVGKTRKYCSRECWYKSRKGLIPKNILSGILWTDKVNKKRANSMRGDKHPNWVESSTNYSTIHGWLRSSVLKKNVCRSCGKVGRTEWALLKGKTYEKKKSNFKELCASCHRQYDKIGERGWITRRLNQKHAFIRR